MSTIAERWDAVHEAEAGLPAGDVFVLASLVNRDKGTIQGSFAEVRRRSAAERLAEATHRLATPEEADAYRLAQEIRKQEMDLAEMKRRMSTFAVATPEMIKQMGILLPAVQAANTAQPDAAEPVRLKK